MAWQVRPVRREVRAVDEARHNWPAAGGVAGGVASGVASGAWRGVLSTCRSLPRPTRPDPHQRLFPCT